MKTLILFVLMTIATGYVASQSSNLMETDLKDLDGFNVNSSEIFNNDGFTLLVFWKSSNEKCCENIESLQNAWAESLREKGVKMVAICVDCSGSWTHVKPIVNARLWDFDVFIDVNGNLKRAMNVSNVPCTIVLNDKQDIVCRQNGYCANSGDLICEIIESKIGR